MVAVIGFSPSRICPRLASAFRSISCTRLSSGSSSSHFSRKPNTSSDLGGACRTSCSSTATWQSRNRRRCVTSQALNSGLVKLHVLEKITRHHRQSVRRSRLIKGFDPPSSSCEDFDDIYGAGIQFKCDSVAARSNALKSVLIEHSSYFCRGTKRSSPRGSLGPSQSNSQRCARPTGRSASAR